MKEGKKVFLSAEDSLVLVWTKHEQMIGRYLTKREKARWAIKLIQDMADGVLNTYFEDGTRISDFVKHVQKN